MRDGDGRRVGRASREDSRIRAAAALRYDPAGDTVPRVVAAGRGVLAVRIEEVALASGVPVYRDLQLAWTLVGLGLDREIPPALYQVVAQVIAWVYYLEGRRTPAGPEPPQREKGESAGRER